MLAPYISDHIAQALARLLQQYKDRPRIVGFYSALVQQIQDLENGLYALDAGRQIWNGTSTPAVGAQLDALGEIVGIGRNGLTDQQYVLFLFGKIGENYSDTTISTILTITQYLFETSLVLLYEEFPAAVGIEVLGTPIPPALYPTAIGLIQASLGAGIRIAFFAVAPTINIFRFDGPGITGPVNGFGDVNNPATGGLFIGLII